jgi:hypothetical protein
MNGCDRVTAYEVTFTSAPVVVVVDAGDVDEALEMATDRYAPPPKVKYTVARLAK